jgi:import inner membrane translocase subunit TIM9
MASQPQGTTESDMGTFREFLKQYNSVTEKCFGACVRDFTSRSVSDKEEKCSKNCLEKFLKMNQRVSLRFQEHQMIQANGQTLT